MITEEIKAKFFESTDKTGRHIIVSKRTGKTYFIEPIFGNRTKWGDLNPATGNLEGHYGEKYPGAVDRADSLITEENGFSNIEELKPGLSPYAVIEARDAKYPDKVA